MKKLYVVGPRNPNMDTIVATVLMSKILRFMGREAIPILSGPIESAKTQMMLENTWIDVPERRESLAGGGEYFLVGHNDPALSVGMDARVVGCIDHHADSGKVSNKYLGTDPSTSLLIYRLYQKQYPFSLEEKRAIYYTFLEKEDLDLSQVEGESLALIEGLETLFSREAFGDDDLESASIKLDNPRKILKNNHRGGK